MIIEINKSRKNVWPGFLFDDEMNDIIDTLHLNLAQQDLFGLMCIYGSEFLEETMQKKETFNKDLKRIPYGFIDRVGSIHFMNMAEGLYSVIQYIKPDFLLKVLKQNPESEFDIRKLSKDLICEFIDEGYRPLLDEDYNESYENLNFRISMKKARILLPVLEKLRAVHITDGHWSNPIRDDLPEKFLNSLLIMCDFDRSLWEEGYYEREYNIAYVRSGLESVTDYKNTAKKGIEECWELSINKKGKELVKWLGNQEEQTTLN